MAVFGQDTRIPNALNMYDKTLHSDSWSKYYRDTVQYAVVEKAQLKCEWDENRFPHPMKVGFVLQVA